ncbi:MAG TPA: FHA domain-containing protein [Pirellulales bacterium]|nr:FHA domain-containing protein [Pirellulales bacterium]
MLERADGTRSEFVVPKPFARIGRDRRAEIALDDASLLPCHAYLQTTREGIYCAGLAPGVPTGWLLPNATIQIGSFRIHASLYNEKQAVAALPDPQGKHSAAAPYPELRVFSGKGRDIFTDHAFSRRMTLVGRQAPATWRIKHGTLSRIHCAFVWEEGELWLIDLFSSNGTRVADRKFDAGALKAGQDFSLGMVRCRYLGPSATATEQARTADSDGGLFEAASAAELDASVLGKSSGLEADDSHRQQSTDSGIRRRIDHAEPTTSPAHGKGPSQAGTPGQQHQEALKNGVSQTRPAETGEPADGPDVRDDGPAGPDAPGETLPRAAALVETRLSPAGDTKFVPPPPPPDSSVPTTGDVELVEEADGPAGSDADGRGRSLEHRLAWLEERFLASQVDAAEDRTGAAAKLARTENALAAAQQKLARFEEELRTERQRWPGQFESLRREAEQQWAGRLGEFAESQRTDRAELIRQGNLAEEDRRKELGALREKLSADLGEEKSRVELAMHELRQLSDGVAHEKTTLVQLAADAAQRLDEQRARAEHALSWQARWEERLEQLSQDVVRRTDALPSQLALLEQSVKQGLEARLAAQAPPAPATGPDGPASASVRAELAAEMTRTAADVDAVRQELTKVAAELSGVRTGQTEFESELNGALREQLSKLGARCDGLERRLEQGLVALSKQLLLQRDEFQGKLAASPSWEGRFHELAQEIERRGAENDRRYAALVASADDRVAALEGTVTAKLADLRSRQQRLAEEIASARCAAVEQAESLAVSEGKPVPLVVEHGAEEPSAFDGQSVLSEFDDAVAAEMPGVVPAVLLRGGLAARPTAPRPPSGDDENPDDPSAPGWLVNDELTQRLLDFRSKRERTARQRRVFWSLAAAGLVLAILAVAGALRSWIHTGVGQAGPPTASSGELP